MPEQGPAEAAGPAPPPSPTGAHAALLLGTRYRSGMISSLRLQSSYELSGR